MKPPDGRYQSAMAKAVNVLSPENYNVEEADSVHLLEGNMWCRVKGKRRSLFRGLRQCYGIEGKRQELGISNPFQHRITRMAVDERDPKRPSSWQSATPHCNEREEKAATMLVAWCKSKRPAPCDDGWKSDSFILARKRSNARGAKGRMSVRSGEERHAATLRGSAV